MSRPPKKDWMEMFETRIEELEGKISDLEQHMDVLNLVSVFHSQIAVFILFIFIRQSVSLENFDSLLEKIKDLVEVIGRSKKPIQTILPENLIAIVIDIAKFRDIPFQNLAPYLVKKLGKRLARRFVEKEAILQHYGEDAFTIWELLLQRGL